MRLRNLIRLLRRQDGISLVMAIGILGVLTVSGTTLVYYSNTNARSAEFSQDNSSAYDLAEAGINEMVAVLSNPENNALHHDLLPTTVRTYDAGSITWSGTLNQATQTWSISSTGRIKNPTGAAQDVTRVLSAKVPVVPSVSQPLNNPAWNYMFSTRTGNVCDQSVSNNVGGASRFYVNGNLCLNQNVNLNPSGLVVHGNLDLENNASVGVNTSMATRTETSVGGWCQYGPGSGGSSGGSGSCSGDQDARSIYSKRNGPSYIVGVNPTPPTIAQPSADFANWYENALPGPYQACTTVSGSPPVFDTNYPARDNNVGTVYLTPAASYTCRIGPAAGTDSTTLAGAITAGATSLSVASSTGFPTIGTFTIKVDNEYMLVTAGNNGTTWTVTRAQQGTAAVAHSAGAPVTHIDPTTGEISWNNTTKTLTVSGTIYIDGSAKIDNAATNQYNGQATIYLSGAFYLSGKLCGGISGSNCDFANWNPNTEMLTIVAEGAGGAGGLVPAGDSVLITNNSSFQGAIYATNAVEYSNNSYSDGPVVASHIILANNVTTQAFPTITTVPAGMPGNPDVYAQPNPPQLYSG